MATDVCSVFEPRRKELCDAILVQFRDHTGPESWQEYVGQITQITNTTRITQVIHITNITNIT